SAHCAASCPVTQRSRSRLPVAPNAVSSASSLHFLPTHPTPRPLRHPPPRFPPPPSPPFAPSNPRCPSLRLHPPRLALASAPPSPARPPRARCPLAPRRRGLAGEGQERRPPPAGRAPGRTAPRRPRPGPPRPPPPQPVQHEPLTALLPSLAQPTDH